MISQERSRRTIYLASTKERRFRSHLREKKKLQINCRCVGFQNKNLLKVLLPIENLLSSKGSLPYIIGSFATLWLLFLCFVHLTFEMLVFDLEV